MTINASNITSAASSASYANRAAEGVTNVARTDTTAESTPSTADLNAAAQAIQKHLSGPIDPPQFKVDYLSGLDVMTVRAASSGEVVFQIPGPAAIRLAQVLKEGGPVESFGLLDKTV